MTWIALGWGLLVGFLAYKIGFAGGFIEATKNLDSVRESSEVDELEDLYRR